LSIMSGSGNMRKQQEKKMPQTATKKKQAGTARLVQPHGVGVRGNLVIPHCPANPPRRDGPAWGVKLLGDGKGKLPPLENATNSILSLGNEARQKGVV